MRLALVDAGHLQGQHTALRNGRALHLAQQQGQAALGIGLLLGQRGQHTALRRHNPPHFQSAKKFARR